MDKEEYEEGVREIINSDEKNAHQYVKEIDALSGYFVEPKSKMVRAAGLILTFSLPAGPLLLIFGI